MRVDILTRITVKIPFFHFVAWLTFSSIDTAQSSQEEEYIHLYVYAGIYSHHKVHFSQLKKMITYLSESSQQNSYTKFQNSYQKVLIYNNQHLVQDNLPEHSKIQYTKIIQNKIIHDTIIQFIPYRCTLKNCYCYLKEHQSKWHCKLEISPEQLVALVQQMPISLLYHRHQQQSNN